MRLHWTHVLVLTAGCLSTALFCLASETSQSRQGRKSAVENPHWKEAGCAACHDPSAGKIAAIATEKIDGLCFSCHDGRRTRAEVHPTHIKFQAETTRPDEWPLAGSELGCITCHDARFGCDLKSHVRADNPRLLRSSGHGPAKDKSFCLNCHQERSYSKLNPHLTLDADGKVLEERCLFCHSKTRDSKALVRKLEPNLKAAQAAICLDCHPRHRDPLVQSHIGLRVTPDEQAYMCAVETTGLDKRPSAQLIATMKTARAQATLLVPALDGTIMCSTCHNPHQAGVFPVDSKLAFGAMKLDGRQKLVSPVREANWCRRCHAN